MRHRTRSFMRGGAVALVLALAATISIAGQTQSPAKPTTAKAAPASAAADGEPVTLRRLLSHTAGLTVLGFPGYAVGAPVPTLVQLLDGVSPANTAAVRIDLKPGTRWRYAVAVTK